MGMGRPPLLTAIVDGKRRCHAYKEWKDISLFYRDPTTKSKYRSRCKECEKERVSGQFNRDIGTALRHLMYRTVKNGDHGSARRKHLAATCQITWEMLMQLWTKQDGKCAVTGVPMTHLRAHGYVVWTNVSLDRIDSTIGYVPDNVRLVCRAVNCIKGALTDREMLTWVGLILNGPLIKK